MNALQHRILASLLAATPLCCSAADPADDCDREQVDAHVRQQIQLYGPRSAKHEHFAFIYRYQGVIASAVIQSRECIGGYSCTVHTDASAKLIPRSAKVLGEWHTHPHQGSGTLSVEDVRGAWNNRHIRCYSAYYARPNGEIFNWDPRKHSVPTAMVSRTSIGNYKAVPVPGAPATNEESRHAGFGPQPGPEPYM